MEDYNQTPVEGAPVAPSPQPGKPAYVPDAPSTWLWQAIVVTILCCMPFGIPAIVYAVKANAAWFAKAYQNYQEYSRKARTWTVITLCVGIVGWLLYLSFYAVILAKLGDLSELGNF